MAGISAGVHQRESSLLLLDWDVDFPHRVRKGGHSQRQGGRLPLSLYLHNKGGLCRELFREESEPEREQEGEQVVGRDQALRLLGDQFLSACVQVPDKHHRAQPLAVSEYPA